jgi:hypothetical protein
VSKVPPLLQEQEGQFHFYIPTLHQNIHELEVTRQCSDFGFTNVHFVIEILENGRST